MPRREKNSPMVQVIPKILRPENCQQLISTFEDCVGSGYSERIDNNGTPRFTQVNLNQVYMDVVPFLVQTMYQLFLLQDLMLAPQVAQLFRLHRFACAPLLPVSYPV